MAPNFQSSFIPKGPISVDTGLAVKKTGLFGYLAITFFVFSIIASGGLFVYKNMLNSKILNLQSELANAEKNIDKKTIGDMIQFSKKLELIKSVIDKHTVVSNFMSIMASSTVSNVSFQSFDYSGQSQKELVVNLKGRAPSYGSIALQEDVFKKNKEWKNVNFSDLKLTDKGAVSFSVNITVDPQYSLYKPIIENAVKNEKIDTKKDTNSTKNTEIEEDLDNFNLDDFNKIDPELDNI